MIKHIDRNTLYIFLIETLNELSLKKGFSMDSKFKFRIEPNPESDKRHNSIDDLMRLGMYTEKNIKGREVDLTTLTTMLSSAPHSRFPLWVNISVSELRKEEIVFEVEMSLRFRVPRVLYNQDTGHPPFKAIF